MDCPRAATVDPKYARANDSFTIATPGVDALSRAAKTRPARTGTRNTAKYSGVMYCQSTERIDWTRPAGSSGEFQARATGTEILTAAASTLAIALKRSSVRS